MSGLGKYVWTALLVAILTHAALLYGFPRVLMSTAMQRVGQGHFNAWRPAPRVTEASRGIVRPAPDLAYSICPYDLSHGPIRIQVAPWRDYWSLSLYQDNSDNYFVIDDREARGGADITLVRSGATPPEHSSQVVESPSTRGVALIRRLAPTQSAYDAASAVAKGDVCAAIVRLTN
ncbi:MAG TPA: DUF1254 domain-containing protein [Vitreimonas sp.]|nr:DUF1254 domain-containing protein [Vitreimonas sp.]